MRAPLVTAVAVLLLAAVAEAQTTGQIEGVVLDQSKTGLPGVTVEVTSPALQGVQTAVSDESGDFRLLVLPPGGYTVRCSLSGFTAVEQPGIIVALGRTVALSVQMQPAFEEHVTVTGAPPAIDVRSPEVGANISKEFFLALPMQRDYASVVQTAPGTTTDGAGPVVYGSSGLENVYYIDGVNTTGTYANFQVKSLDFEFIQEVQVKTGSYAAEFGHSTGGVVNVITRSGGNEFHGDVFGYYFSDALQSSPKAAVETFNQANQGSSVIEGFRKADVGFDLGGYLLKDRLWFFAAYNPVKNSNNEKVTKDFSPYGGPPEGKVYVDDKTTQLWAAKLTGRIGVSHSLVASAFGDPARDTGPVGGGLNGEESTFLGVYDTGGGDAMLQYQGVLGGTSVVEAQVSRFTTRFIFGGPGAMIPQVVDMTTPLYAQTGTPSVHGGLGGYYDRFDARDTVRLNASFFVGHLAGDHEIKTGGEAERVGFDLRGYTSGGQFVVIRCARGHLTLDGCPADWVYYSHDMNLTTTPPGGLFDPNFGTYVTDVSAVRPKNENRAAFVQDTWRLTPALTLNLGVRWERQQMYDNHGVAVLEVDHELAPRAGFAWDFRGEGASKLFGSWGRFYEVVPLTLSGEFVSGEPWASVSNRDSASVLCDPVLNADPTYRRCNIYTVDATPVDPAGVKGEFIDEAVLGAEVVASRDLVLGAKLVYRNLGRVIEDSLTAGGGYYIGNPSYGLLETALDQSYTWAIPVPRPKRTFKGLELTATKRMSDNWQMMASYLYSELKGNYDGNYYPDVGQAGPNISVAYDYGEFTVHNSGYLGNDRRHQAKVSAVYAFPFHLSAGASAHYRSGTPLSAIGASSAYGCCLYLSQRGTWGRTAAEYEMDLHLGYPIKVGGAEVNLLLDFFHLLNRQGETGRDQSYNFDQTVDVIDYATGKPLPPIAPGTPCTSLVSPDNAVTCNASFNTANAWQDPRSVRLGVRVTF